MNEQLSHAKALVRDARSVVVLSGAGLSAASGVPTFRDAQTGLWERFDPAQLATEDAFRKNPSLVWTWYVWRWLLVRAVEPNAGHEAVAQWQRKLTASGGQLTVATQNVDDLHERAGAQGVLHLHGSLDSFRCLDCQTPSDYDPRRTGCTAATTFEASMLLDTVSCEHCETGILRPGVVWFGEMLPESAFAAAVTALQDADLVMVIGSSGLVQPAASLPSIGRDAGAKVIEINPAPSGLMADLVVAESAAIALPQLVAAAEESGS